jgi:hypothetical protein
MTVIDYTNFPFFSQHLFRYFFSCFFPDELKGGKDPKERERPESRSNQNNAFPHPLLKHAQQ